MNNLGKVQAFTTEELGVISMDIGKQEFIDMVQKKNIKFRETARTVTLKNKDRTNMMFFIFSDELDRIISADLGRAELVTVVIDGEEYSPNDIRQNLKWKHTMKCEYRGKTVVLDKHMNAICYTGCQCRMCSSAGCITHEARLSESIVYYVDFGDATDNEMFCFENNHGKSVDFRKIRREDAKAKKEKLEVDIK